MYHVFSTLANDNRYVRYSPNTNGIRTVEHSILINGGSGINKKHIGTPYGVHTAIEDEDYEWLKDDFSFQQHMKRGYITVRKMSANPATVAKDMVTRDQKTDACPVVPDDFNSDADKDTVKPMKKKK